MSKHCSIYLGKGADFQGSLYFHNDQNHTYNHMQGEHNKPAFTYLHEKEANLIAGIDT